MPVRIKRVRGLVGILIVGGLLTACSSPAPQPSASPTPTPSIDVPAIPPLAADVEPTITVSYVYDGADTVITGHPDHNPCSESVVAAVAQDTADPASLLFDRTELGGTRFSGWIRAEMDVLFYFRAAVTESVDPDGQHRFVAENVPGEVVLSKLDSAAPEQPPGPDSTEIARVPALLSFSVLCRE